MDGGPAALKAKDAAKEAVKPKATNTESPLNPKDFVDFKLKAVEPYNWNTDRCVFACYEVMGDALVAY
jgi:hypothetical protein